MSQIINLQALVETIANDISTDNTLVENFIRSLTDEIADRMSAGQQTEIPGIGTFGTVTMGDDTDIIWQPDKELADDINSPFSSFEPVVLAEEVTEEILNGQPEPESAPQETVESLKSPDTLGILETLETPETLESPETLETPENLDTLETPETPDSSGGWWWWTFALLLSAIIGYLCATYLPNPLHDLMAIPQDDYEENVVNVTEKDSTTEYILPTEVIADSTALTAETGTDSLKTINQPQAIQPTVTDTVRNGRFLATMARRHYGSYKFWVYIYMENAGHISNPDNLPVGTILVIPPAEKYGIDSHDPASIARAEAEIRRIEKR